MSGVRFEYGVILNGSQKYSTRMETIKGFEYGVEYGVILRKPFEYGVILNGSQTYPKMQILKSLFEYGVRKARLNSGFPFIVYSSSNQFS